MTTSRTFPFDEISPWVETPTDLQAPLASDQRADVVVIGGGYTGLSTALSLRAQGVDVAIIEQGFAGSGASGRNAGHVAPTIGKDIPTLLRLFGRERAGRLARFADAAVEYTEEAMRTHDIECEYVANGNIMAGVHPKQEARLRKAAEAARSLGAAVRFLDGAGMRERGIPPAFRFGIFEERGGTLHPGRYVMALRRAALAAGVRLFEKSPLAVLEDGSQVTARTAQGTIKADAAVLATNAYTHATGWKSRTVVPLRVSLFETAPLNEAQLADLGWRHREGVYTAHEALESFRLTARNTIVGGSKVVSYAWGSALPPAYDPAAFSTIEGAFRERFPMLGKVPVERFWSGWIGLTTDFLPVLGVTGAHNNVFYGLGYCGHGVPQATLMGAMLAERVQGRQHELESALRRRNFAWLPEPLRWAGATVIRGVLEALDRRTDRQIRALR